MRNKRKPGLGVLITSLAFLLTACGAASTTPAATVTPTPSDVPSQTQKPSPAPTATASTAPADPVFTTPDGAMSFTYPAKWTVAPDETQTNTYKVTDGKGTVRAVLRDKVDALPTLSVAYGVDSGYSAPVPGVTSADGSAVRIIVQGSYGQAPGSQAAIFAIASVTDSGPIGKAAIEVPNAGYYVTFGGSVPLKTGNDQPTETELAAAAATYSASPEFTETAKVMASLTLDQRKVVQAGCFGSRYKYDKLTGTTCDEAKSTLDRVEKTGTGAGARSMETADFMCFYAGYVEKQGGHADVICRNKTTPDGISFQAWLK